MEEKQVGHEPDLCEINFFYSLCVLWFT